MAKEKDDVIIDLRKVNEMLVEIIKKKDDMIAKIDVTLKETEQELNDAKAILKKYARQCEDILDVGRLENDLNVKRRMENMVIIIVE
ncbi:hypothetical protein J1N35_021623 [Gossypium stocksii]|uniref:Uncharacterized protein n=1 Tax=Gossypium stocksii TaxID=47602 RepID=A0A9D4A207_9ROSI|nr:hypothetical protein J1N35_021623 [Gossypium stocksii]